MSSKTNITPLFANYDNNNKYLSCKNHFNVKINITSL